jgi:hypothetical protein
MYKLHCDLCDRDISKDENTTKVTWEDNQGIEFSTFGHAFRKPRKLTVDICDTCLDLLKRCGTSSEK